MMVPYSVFAKIDKKYKFFTVLRENIFKIPLENLLIFSFQKNLYFMKISLYRLRSHDFMMSFLHFLGSKQGLSGHNGRNSKLYLSFSRRWGTGSITVFVKKNKNVKKLNFLIKILQISSFESVRHALQEGQHVLSGKN